MTIEWFTNRKIESWVEYFEIDMKQPPLVNFKKNPCNDFRIYCTFQFSKLMNETDWGAPKDVTKYWKKWNSESLKNKAQLLETARCGLLNKFSSSQLKSMGYTAELQSNWHKGVMKSTAGI